jgi:hypothetical protein
MPTPDMGMMSSCTDRMQDGDESDVDCGGSCPPCLANKMCVRNSDCASMSCDPATHVCTSLQCSNNMQDGNETDVDCGGGVCMACAAGKHCKMGSDCVAAMCSPGKVCITTCQDGVKDGSETDVDCGGTCPACAVDKACLVSADCTTGSCMSKFCVPASGPPSWITLSNCPSARRGVTAVTASDGRIWVIGGQMNGLGVARVDIYNPATDTWDPGPPQLPSARMYTMSVAFGGNLYVIGGSGLMTSALHATQWIDNALPAMPLADGSALATVGPDNKFYVAGGEVGTGTAGNYGKVTLVYDPSAGTWSQLPLLSVIHGGPGSAWGTDGHLYVYGGGDVEDVTVTNLNEMYDPAQTKWVTKAPLSAARVYLGSLAAPDGRLYAMGGLGLSRYTLCEAYRPALDLWVTTSPLKIANDAMGTALGQDGRMFLLSGETATTQAYGPAVTLSATMANRGAMVSVDGNNFAASATVTVTFDGTPIGSGSTDAFGGLTATIGFTVPNVGAGPHLVTVTDNKSLYPITLKLTVN